MRRSLHACACTPHRRPEEQPAPSLGLLLWPSPRKSGPAGNIALQGEWCLTCCAVKQRGGHERPESALSINESIAHQVSLRGSAVTDTHFLFAPLFLCMSHFMSTTSACVNPRTHTPAAATSSLMLKSLFAPAFLHWNSSTRCTGRPETQGLLALLARALDAGVHERSLAPGAPPAAGGCCVPGGGPTPCTPAAAGAVWPPPPLLLKPVVRPHECLRSCCQGAGPLLVPEPPAVRQAGQAAGQLARQAQPHSAGSCGCRRGRGVRCWVASCARCGGGPWLGSCWQARLRCSPSWRHRSPVRLGSPPRGQPR